MLNLKIYIVGNGFDVAHGLETKYSHFYNSCSADLKKEAPMLTGIESSIFWSDFEYNYFRLLKLSFLESEASLKRLISNPSFVKYAHSDSLNKIYIPDSINSELEYIKKKLKSYLNGVTEDRKELFHFEDIFKQSWTGKEKPDNLLDGAHRIIILNFNYTSIPRNYYDDKNTDVINIHGQLNNPNNPMIFGLGDEYSEEYKQFENTNNDEYMRNLKSNQYLLSKGYSSLFSYIRSASEIKIDIIGHSCSISDRSLLREIFQSSHNDPKFSKIQNDKVKVKGIRIYHYDGKTSYIEVLNRISRIFESNVDMREKVEDYNDRLIMPK